MRYLLPVVLLAGTLHAAEPAPRLRLEGGKFEVVGLARAELDALKKMDLKGTDAKVFEVFVAGDKPDDSRPAMLGKLTIEGETLCFEPRFPPVVGLRYRAVFRPSLLKDGASAADVRGEFSIPRPKPTDATTVTHVFPTRSTLPENQLKFYIHFSAPMSRGEAYRSVRVLDESGKPIALPFLELDQELWDPAGKRLTLLFDPGRIKRGLKPREEDGPILVEGKKYTFVIDRKWQDADGNALKESFRKEFKVAAPENKPIEIADWKLTAPRGDGVAALDVRFPKPLDHALLQRLLWITDARGKRVAGTIQVLDDETRWQFTPERPWQPGKYDLVIDTSLEDLAGNRVGKTFEVDQFDKVDREVKVETVKRAFVVEK
jgi:hypothetical protein